MFNDPRATARHYYRNLPRHVLTVEEPAWWPPLGLGSGIINVGFETDFTGPLAIIACRQSNWSVFDQDVKVIADTLKQLGRPQFDAMPRNTKAAHGRMVGMVEVTGLMHDHDADGLWFDGPVALRVQNPLLLVDDWRLQWGDARQRATGLFEDFPPDRVEGLQMALLETARTA